MAVKCAIGSSPTRGSRLPVFDKSSIPRNVANARAGMDRKVPQIESVQGTIGPGLFGCRRLGYCVRRDQVCAAGTMGRGSHDRVPALHDSRLAMAPATWIHVRSHSRPGSISGMDVGDSGGGTVGSHHVNRLTASGIAQCSRYPGLLSGISGVYTTVRGFRPSGRWQRKYLIRHVGARPHQLLQSPVLHTMRSRRTCMDVQLITNGRHDGDGWRRSFDHA
jgi:hypothetical protein